jgi:DNA-binding GntR family transcriptional regulator
MSPLNLPTRALYLDVAEWLRQRIYSRALKPGEWLDELKLAQELGISRTPLREAIKVLAAEGLVTMRLRRGAYVTDVSQEDLQQVYELLGELESGAAGTVAAHATPTQVEELKALHEQLRLSQDDAERFFDINEKFHRKILELSGNRWRLQVINDLRKVMKVSRLQSLAREGRIAASLAEHEAILQAIVAGKADMAAQAMRHHFKQGLLAAT